MCHICTTCSRGQDWGKAISMQVSRQRRNELRAIVLIGKLITKSTKINDNSYHFFIYVLTQDLLINYKNSINTHNYNVCFWCDSPQWARPHHLRGFYITHNDAPQSVGLLWTSDQLVAETSTWQHTTLIANKHPCPRCDSNPQSQQASGRRPTPFDRVATGTGHNKVRHIKCTQHFWNCCTYTHTCTHTHTHTTPKAVERSGASVFNFNSPRKRAVCSWWRNSELSNENYHVQKLLHKVLRH